MGNRRLAARLGLVALVTAAVAGCAREREPINKVQANALAKKFFVGEQLSNGVDDPEFYASTTVVDVPYGVQASVFTGAAGELRRVKWEITEKVLNARLTYESIDGVDGKGTRTTNGGQVVASFAIDGHFDIRRDYNPQTGEELNVVVENTSDRPWYSREYMRVDWSSNKVESAYSFDPLSTLKLAGQEVEPITYRVDDPSDPDAPVIDAEGGYFDVTNKVYIKPRTLQGQPACYFSGAVVVGGTYPFGGCDSSEVKLRLSFMRIARPGEPGDRDFEPQEWDGARFNAHGAFTHDRLGYDRHFGVIDSKWHHLIQRYNIWQKSHADTPCATGGGDAHADADRDGTEDACASVGAGSRCDDLVGACTIPLAKRTTRTNAWHFNLNVTDEVAFDSTQHATEEWDTALRLAVQAGRRVECQRTAGASIVGTPWEGLSCTAAFPINQRDEAEVESVRALEACQRANGAAACPAEANSVASLPKMIALCHNPVSTSDDPSCGAPGLVTRPGDLRYHQVNVVPTPQSASPWGYGPTSADPLTGEVIQASINIWNTVTDQAAQTLVDQVRWINGEIAPEKVTTGDYVQDWARAASAHVPGASTLMTPEQIDERILGRVTGAASPNVDRGALARRSVDVGKLNRDIAARSAVATGQPGNGLPTTLSGARAQADARMEMAKGTPVEAALVTGPWLQMAGVQQAKVDADVLDRASPIRGLDADNMAKVEQKVNAALAAKGQCMMMAPEPTGVVPLAKIMAKKFPYDANASAGDQAARIDRMWNFLRGKLNYAVIAHEMGHTIGLRHNFASSFDSFNYRPQYWQLRTRGGQVTTPCTGPVADGSTCVGPRYYDPLDSDEIDQMIWMWSQTSVMDYAGDPTQDTIGLGVYDYSAARAFYADVVDVRNDGVKVPRTASASVRDAMGAQMFDMVDTIVRPLAHAFVTGADPNVPLHYSQWNSFFRLINKCEHVETLEPAGWNRARDGEYDPVFDGHIVRSERCERMPVDYVDWREMVADTSVDPRVNYDPRFVVSRRALDTQGRPRMPYAFGTDDAVEAGIPSTYQHDNGADVFEEMSFHDGLYEDRHIFDNFRRGRVNFSIVGAYQRATSRYHNKIAGLAQQYSFIHDFILRDAATGGGVPYSELVAAYEGQNGFLRDFAVASALAFDHFARVLTRPQPGPHSFVGKDPVLRPLDGAEVGTSFPHDVDIPQGSAAIAGDVSFGGRPIQNSVVSSNGYWNVNQAGSYYEKTHAIFSLLAQGMGSGNWSRSEGVDSRWLSSNIGNTYPNGVRQLLGALLTEDQELYAPRIPARGSGLPDVLLDSGRGTKYPRGPMGWVSFASPSGPAVCWPTNGNQVCTDGSGGAVAGALTGPANSVAVDPELGFEIQKFVLFYAYVFLPGNQRNDWVDMLRISKLGNDSSPVYTASEMIEWKDPQTGYRYLAKRFGDEQLMGKTYDRGMGAKMLQWANALTAKAYAPNDPAVPNDPETGRFVYKTDGRGQPVVLADVETNVAPDDPEHVTCEENHHCVQLRNYRALLDYSRDTAARLGFPDPWLNGIYQ